MSFPVKLTLYKDGQFWGESVVENEAGLRLPIEMYTGTGWLDAAGLYQELLDRGCDQVSDTFRVCHSYEKWGAMQQEVVMVKARLQRLGASLGGRGGSGEVGASWGESAC